ncbi:signal peptidase I [Neobacillus sp. PS3-40]|uniref:signal peptidase I n=1 Tax=Neobacillus sp. PS3-40 TaxID=3070679 RepID=UPI0027DFAC9B|nr:signal peptidase I [Neobacillus sp. PS3-40]WML44134.1 signal peptidase I [Neobacillus sp. PS3-40]
MKNTKSELFSWIKSIFFALLVAFICRHFIFSPVTVFGESMKPTFEDQNKLIVTKISKIDRFDMIVFDAPDSNENYIKRVIGLPGDKVEMKNDTLYINGKKYKEPYLKTNKEGIASDEKLTGDFDLMSLLGKSVVPKNSLFVMGDNRRWSKDSRIFGFISKDSVIGKVQLRYYPIKEIGAPK